MKIMNLQINEQSIQLFNILELAHNPLFRARDKFIVLVKNGLLLYDPVKTFNFWNGVLNYKNHISNTKMSIESMSILHDHLMENPAFYKEVLQQKRSNDNANCLHNLISSPYHDSPMSLSILKDILQLIQTSENFPPIKTLVNKKNTLGATSLHLCVLKEKPNYLRELLSFNPSLKIKDVNGLTPVKLAEKFNPKILSVFKEHEILTEKQDLFNHTTQEKIINRKIIL